jgi:hypothetical protein
MNSLPLLARWKICPVLAVVSLAAPACLHALTITFDYSYDTGNFFNTQAKKDALNAAAAVFTSRITDSLSAIAPGGSNSWSANFINPATGGVGSTSNLNVGANELVIYVGARDLGGSVLGSAGPGGFSSSGVGGWNSTVAYRGQSGASLATPTDFGPWGGSISFSSTAAWYFDSDPSTIEAGLSGNNDFYSVAVHELGHVLGVGTATSWTNKISGTTFTGSNSTISFGGNPSVTGDGGHWADGTTSLIPGTSTAQETAMDPTITTGTRKYFTNLDFAGLQDIGWQVTAVPEPATIAWVAVIGAVGALRWRRRRA